MKLAVVTTIILASTAIATAAITFAAIDEPLIGANWQEIVFDDKTPNSYSMAEPGVIDVNGTASVSVLWRSLAATKDSNWTLSWSWLVDAGPPSTDLANKGGDDRALSLYVSFEFDPERSSFWERSKRALVQPFVEDELPGRVLLYVWGGKEVTDEWVESPYFSGIGKMKILRAADAQPGVWFDEVVDLVADHEAAFGEKPTAPYQLAISSDSDDTGTTVQAKVGRLTFADQLLR